MIRIFNMIPPQNTKYKTPTIPQEHHAPQVKQKWRLNLAALPASAEHPFL